MTQPTKTEAIKAFLNAYTHPDLAALYNHDLEVQITVSKGKGERTTGEYKGKQWQAYTDGFQTWKPIRIPVNANTKPEYTDSPMQYDLKDHAEGIGMTGWDWKNLLSRWVAFDFDAITGHSEKHTKKLNETELEQIKTAVANIPYVSLRKSTGGRGLHIYVFLKPIHTDNHNEHAAVARAILSQLSGIAGFDFSSKVDICGGNMWVWHSKLAGTGGEGLKLLKVSTELATVPANWKDYTKVVSGHRTKNLPKFIESQADTQHGIEDIFNELTGQRLRQPIDSEHKVIMSWLHENYPSASWWDAEHHMLVTHTALLKECHAALNLRGKFETEAKGSEKGYDHNCFMFPISRGAFSVRRFSIGVKEHAYWQQDGTGWTSCFFNREPTVDQASNLYEGIEDTDGSYWFASGDRAQQAAHLLGADLALPPWALQLGCRLKLHKSGRLIAVLEKNKDSPHLPGWLVKGNKLSKMFSIKQNPSGSETEVLRLDDQVRHMVSEGLDDCGWALKAEAEWHNEPIAHIKLYLQSIGYNPQQLSSVLGASVSQCWRLVNLPFREEYPGKRQWNRKAAQLRVKPSLNRDSLSYPSWTKILNHCGKNLDAAVSQNEWCKANGVLTGADWLKCWIASMFQEPLEPLPYIFFYGPQNSGKSIFHEALELLVNKGVCRADQALVSGGGFNGELEGKVLCVIEEVDLKKNVSAYNRIKDWVTSKLLPIHRKMEQPYMTPNSTHWIQCLPKDSWILTSEGHRQVAELTNKDVTVIVDGQGYKTKGFYETGFMEVYTLKTNQGHTLRATSSHPILTDYDGLRLWKPIGELNPGDRICFNKHLDVEWFGEGTHEEGYVLGYLFADGTLTNCHLEIEHKSDDYCLIPKLLQGLKGDCTLNRLEERWEIHSPELRRICSAFGVTDKKEINPHIEEASSDFLSGFLSGFFDGDGCVNVTESNYLRVCLQQTDAKILEAVQRILLCFGIYSKVSGEQLRICNQSVETFAKRIGFWNPNKQKKLLELLAVKKFRANNDFTDEIKSITVGQKETVYDVTVPGAECFSANGFKVHNCANTHLYCPVFPGDTRITMILVESLKPEDLIPKKTLLTQLENEAPDFLAEILSVELPPSGDRLNVPCIATEDKVAAEYANQSMLEVFCVEKVFFAPGHKVKFSEFSDKFHEWLDPNAVAVWSKIRIGRELPPKYVKARLPSTGEWWVGNMSLVQVAEKDFGPKFHRKDGKLYQEVETAKTDGVNVVMDINFIPGAPPPEVIAIVPGPNFTPSEDIVIPVPMPTGIVGFNPVALPNYVQVASDAIAKPIFPEENNGSDQRNVRDGGSPANSSELPPPVS